MKQTIWKTITIGTKEPKFNKDTYISDWAKYLLKKVTYPKKKEEIDLVIMTPRDLGFTSHPTTKKLFDEKNLEKYGVELCPASVGPYLRSEYDDQPMSEYLYIAMNPISDSDGSPSVFCVEHFADGDCWLYGRWAFPGSVWSLDYRIVFRLRYVSQHSASSDTLSSNLPAETSVEAVKKSQRRIRVDLLSPPELAIRNAIMMVENLGADVLLTDAVVLLGEAQEKIAEYIEKI